MTDHTDLIARLRERATVARSENTGTALGDALHFEEAATTLEALARENAELREAGGWQPIETAPRDGTVLLMIGNVYRGLPFPCAFEIDGLNPGGRWMNQITRSALYGHALKHWTPIPAPPTPQQSP